MTAPVCLPVDVRPVPGFPSLRVGAGGEVYGPRGLRRPGPDRHGYLYVSVRIPGQPWPGKVRVHTAVLLAWVGPRPAGMEGRHINGDQADNRLENLTWSSHVVNIADKVAHGTMARGGDVGTARLTDDDVRKMRRLWPSLSLAALAARFGVGKSTADDVVKGRTWGHLP